MGSNGNNEITIAGYALTGTIDSLKSTGISYDQILAKRGIKKIKDNSRYSVDVRVALHEEAYSIFGDDALFAFGFANTLKFIRLDEQAWGVRDPRNNTVKELKRYMVDVCRSMGDSAKQALNVYEGRYGGKITYKSSGIFIYRYATGTCLRHIAFSLGMLECFLTSLRKYWSYEIFLQRSLCKEGKQWAEFVWKIKFKRINSKISIGEIKAIRRLEVEQNFLKVVLKETRSQRNKIERLSYQLGKFLPPQIHDSMVRGDYEAKIQTRRKKLTIFFSDIVNFTLTTEGLQPEDLTKYLNEYFSEMTNIAIEYGATIDKYIGDSLMLFFGDPDSKGEREDARACVMMALKMRVRMHDLQHKWRNEGFSSPFQIRIGINTGYCNVGNFGSDQRLTYTIIGGEVNIAQRLESSADADGIQMSYETYAHCQDLVRVKERETIKMKGINRPVKILTVHGGNGKTYFKTQNIDENNPLAQEGSDSRMEDRLTLLEKRVNHLIKKLAEK